MQNDQSQIAKAFLQQERDLLQKSRTALLKIQTWHFANERPKIAERYGAQAARMVRESLLSYVQPYFVLHREHLSFINFQN